MDFPAGFFFDKGTPEKPKHDYYYNGKKMTGCTTILGVLSKPALIPWAAKMACEYVKDNSERIEDDWRVTAETLKLAQTAHARTRDKRAEEGTDLHAKIEEYINLCITNNKGIPMNATDEVKGFSEWAKNEHITFLSSEQKFFSASLFVAGTADFVFEKGGLWYIGDIKNKKKIYSREPFAQCAGYSIMAEEMGFHSFNGYCVIRVWNGEVEPLWSYDTEGGKQAFLSCVNLYRWLANFK